MHRDFFHILLFSNKSPHFINKYSILVHAEYRIFALHWKFYDDGTTHRVCKKNDLYNYIKIRHVAIHW